MYRYAIKRILDILTSIVLLVFFLPLLILTALVLFFTNKGSVFFYQVRPGLNEKPFTLIKFKSMFDSKDSNGVALTDKERMTPFGRFIRNTSIDELPQLLNVLSGSMSLVGPRPLLFKYLPLYNDNQRQRHNVKPGITGLAQVKGRNTIPWKNKFRYDYFYVNHISFLFDLKILWLTLLKVLKREGINQSDDNPMMPFDGTN